MVTRLRKRVGSLIILRKFIYLISPNKINKKFYGTLSKVLSSGNVKFFQLRMKKYKKDKILEISKQVKKITNKFKVKFILNDDYNLSIMSKTDGCHIGQNDGSIKDARKKLKRKILGVTCHNSKLLVMNALKYKADYVALGSFYKSKLKPQAKKSNFKTLKWAKQNIKKPIVAIGGINNLNYKKLIKFGAKYIALSSYIWDNKKLKPEIAIKKFK